MSRTNHSESRVTSHNCESVEISVTPGLSIQKTLPSGGHCLALLLEFNGEFIVLIVYYGKYTVNRRCRVVYWTDSVVTHAETYKIAAAKTSGLRRGDRPRPSQSYLWSGIGTTNKGSSIGSKMRHSYVSCIGRRPIKRSVHAFYIRTGNLQVASSPWNTAIPSIGGL